MRPLGRRRICLVFTPVAWIVMPITWVLRQQASPVVRFTYPLLVAYLIWAWLRLRLVPTSVLQVERATFWALAGFWLGSMASGN